MIWYPYAYICTCRRTHGMQKQVRKCMYSITLMAHLVIYKSGTHDNYILQTTETTHINRTDSKGQVKY